MYCYLKFKLRYLKNMKLFTSTIQELFEPIVFREKSQRVFALFKCMFLRNRSSSKARWFYGKRRNSWKWILHLSENWFSRIKMWWVVFNYNYMRHIIMCKVIFRFELELNSYWQNINFSWNCLKFHIQFAVFNASDNSLQKYLFYFSILFFKIVDNFWHSAQNLLNLVY